MQFRGLFFPLLFLSLPTVAQTLQGVVTDAGTHKPLYPVTVVNVFTQQVAYTDANGFYNVPARQGDIIAFSYIGYKTVERRKPLSVIIATLNMSMERKEYELDAIILRPGHLSQYQFDSTERAITYKIYLQREHPSIMSPASAIAEKFSKKAKRTYQFQKDFAEGEANKFIDSRYTPALVTSLTGLTGDSIGYFMNTYPMPFDYARTASNLEMKMWIRENYKQWQEKADSIIRSVQIIEK